MPNIIEEMYCFVATGEDGDEGVIGFLGPDQNWVPLVGADMMRVNQLREIARQIGKESGKVVTLKKFKLVGEECVV